MILVNGETGSEVHKMIPVNGETGSEVHKIKLVTENQAMN